MADQTSASMSIDPDRLIQEHFENRASTFGIQKKVEKLLIQEEDPVTCATFALRQEDHTLGNLLRHIIILDKDVEFCGYSQPHPSESKVHLRIQSKNPQRAAVDILNEALDVIIELSKHTIKTFTNAMDSQSYKTEMD